MNGIVLGPVSQFDPIPAEIEVEGRPCMLLKDGSTYRVVSRKCPHAGQLVEWEDGELVCPMHGWSFNPHTGACLNVPAKGLREYSVVVQDGVLIVELLGSGQQG